MKLPFLSSYTNNNERPLVIMRRSLMKKRGTNISVSPSLVLLSASGSNNDDNSSNDSSSSKNSIARAGGRISGRSSSTPDKYEIVKETKKNDTTSGIIDIAKKAIPLLLLLSLLKGLFGFLFGWGTGSNESYVYYQSTVYESRTYDADGKMERIRKESVKSNVPSMINGNKEEGEAKSKYLQQSDEEFDRELDNIIQRSINTW